MKRIWCFLLITQSVLLTAQVGINTSTPDPSAVLDLSSTNQGFLPPRMTGAERDAIVSPVAGLQVWCTNCGPNGETQVYNGNIWTNMIGGTASAVLDNTPPVITLVGDSPITIVQVNDNYIDLGATATDDLDGNINHSVEVSGDVVNKNVPGTYTIRYNVSDSTGNAATEVTRIVIIISNQITDGQGNVYDIVAIGNQFWTKNNAEMTTYRDGTSIPQVTDAGQWANLTTGAWCYYNNDLTTGNTYGKLYNWYALAGIHDNDSNTPNKAFAPEGWHVSSDAEWVTLENYLITNGYNYDGSTTGDKIAKSIASTTLWTSSSVTGAIGNDLSSNNTSGLNTFPGGYRSNQNGTYNTMGNYGFFWTSTEENSTDAWYRMLASFDTDLSKINNSKMLGFSVRFVRD